MMKSPGTRTLRATTLRAATALLLAGALLTACTITPAAPPTTEAPPVTSTPAGETDTAALAGQAVTTTTSTAGAGAEGTTAAEGGTTGTVTSTTTVVTTTVTTVTEGAPVSSTNAATDVAGVNGTAAALPTATPAAGITVTTAVSTPVAASAQASAATTATTVLTDANAGTIMQVISTTAGLETLASVLMTSGMSTALEQPGPLTFFAPTNDAFAALQPGQLDSLLADPTTLTPILQYHIVIDNVSAAQLGTLGTALSSTGLPITTTVQSDGSLLVNDAHLVQGDIPAANGVVHLIDKLLIPPPAVP